MKPFILIALFISMFSFNIPAYSQEASTDLSPLPMEDIKQDKEETIFSKASDDQIKEAENFYDSCAQNETMSAIKNCKCAATAYLDTRMKLGKDASVKQIMDENIDKCLKDNNKTVAAEGDLPDLSYITDKELDEANAMLEHCQSTLKLSRYYDCECYAAKYLDGRLNLGSLASKEEILYTFYNDCRNIIETTGHEYTRCMKKTLYRPIEGVESKDFCECYARQWAKNFEAYQGTINLSSRRMMRLRARAYCNRTMKPL